MKLVDSHIHLDFPVFSEDRESLLAKAESAGIARFVVPATTRDSWLGIQQLSHEYQALCVAYGIHPYFITHHTLKDCEALESWIQTHPCVAIGEIGLDYFLKGLDPLLQMDIFKAQLNIAKRHNLPVILHARKAIDEVTRELKKTGLKQGIVHSFNGSEVQAKRLIDMGFKLGFGGALTYSRATRLQALVKCLPLAAICLETDAPDQPSSGFAGKRNEPIALIEILETVAKLRNTSTEEIARHTWDNTCSVFPGICYHTHY